MSNKPDEVSPRTSTIPSTPTAPGWIPVQPRSLAPILPHPRIDTTPVPSLPVPPRPSVFHTTTHGTYQLSTHLVPAAYPRHTPDIPRPVMSPYIPGKARHAKMGELLAEVQAREDAYVKDELGGKPSEKLFWNCVNRYVRTPGTGGGTGTGITLFSAHANGFHKETWETMLRGLLDAPGGEMVDEVWAWDAVQHGDSAVVNAKNLSGIFDWLDNTRDIANFLLHYLPEHAEATVLPTRLQCLPTSITKYREEHGYSSRKLVVVGHSFGGCTSLRAAIDFPKLFSSFVLVDPIIHRPSNPGRAAPMTLGAFSRRDRWSSREEARQLFLKSPFFGAWHPDVLQDYVDYALIDDVEGSVTLKMTGLQEGLSFAATWRPAREMWMLLERLDERIALRWVIPGVPIVGMERTPETVWRRPANSSNIVFHFAGHLIVQEAPYELAHEISEFLVREYGCTKTRL